MNEIKKHTQISRFTNNFALNAEIGFTDARQLLLFLALVSQTNPQDPNEEMTGILSVQDIAQLIRSKDAKKSGSLYKELGQFTEKMMESNYLKFSPSIDIDDEEAKKHLKDYGVIFDRLQLFSEGGTTFYKYRFHEDMRPHIKLLKENFVSLEVPKGMKSGHAIRFLVLAKAHHDKYRAAGKVKTTIKKIAIIDLKRILGIENKYAVIADLKKRVINPIVNEINKSGFLYIPNHQYIKDGRTITHIEFYFEDGELYKKNVVDVLASHDHKGLTDFVPNDKDIDKLTWAELRAYHYLVNLNCKPGIVYRQILPKMPSSEYKGWEDIFVQKAWEHFEKKTKLKDVNLRAGAFIKWWGSGEFKDRLFSQVMEAVQKVKKKTSKDQEAWDNRKVAINMTAAEFKQWHKKQQTPTKTDKGV